jgi:hypothetical protein
MSNSRPIHSFVRREKIIRNNASGECTHSLRIVPYQRINHAHRTSEKPTSHYQSGLDECIGDLRLPNTDFCSWCPNVQPPYQSLSGFVANDAG